MSHQGVFEYMFQYGVLKYVPSKNVHNMGPNKECSLIYVPLRERMFIVKMKKTTINGKILDTGWSIKIGPVQKGLE